MGTSLTKKLNVVMKYMSAINIAFFAVNYSLYSLSFSVPSKSVFAFSDV